MDATVNTHFTSDLGSALRRHRKARGWSIAEAASRAGLSMNTLANTERTALPNPTLGTLLSLMDIYEVNSLEELLGELPTSLLLRTWVSAGRPGVRNPA